MDLDELIRSELTAQAARAPDPTAVLAGARTRGQDGRRRRTVVGAAAAAAVLAAGIPYAALRGGDDPAGSAPARTMLPDVELIDRCAARAPAYVHHQVTKAELRVLARTADERGYSVWVGNSTWSVADCAFRWDGGDDGVGGDLLRDGTMSLGYLPDRAVVELDRQLADAYPVLPDVRPAGAYLLVRGQVARGVTRVVVRAPGHPPVDATLSGPFWIARVLGGVYRGRNHSVVIEAYDQYGGELKTIAG